MKAIEYAEMFIADPTADTLTKIAKGMILEVADVFTKRHAKSDETLFSILNEAIGKWKAFVREVEKRTGVKGMREDGLKQLILLKFPFIPEHRLK